MFLSTGATSSPLVTVTLMATLFSPLQWSWSFVIRYLLLYGKPLLQVLLMYNMLCSALSLYATVGMAVVISQLDVIYTNSATPGLMPYYRVYAYTKIIELLDTVFMIVRHKGRQITILHVFHHSTMLLLIFYAMEWVWCLIKNYGSSISIGPSRSQWDGKLYIEV